MAPETQPQTPDDPKLHRKIARHWDVQARSFDRRQGVRARRQARSWSAFLEHQLGTEPRRVLDVGTGTGFLALRASELGHRVTGLDLSAGMVIQARRNTLRRDAEDTGLPVADWLRGDAQRLPFAPASFDVLLSRNLIWTLPQPELALAEWRRVLVPGGLLVLVDGNWFDSSLAMKLRRGLGHTVALLSGRNTLAQHRRQRGAYTSNLPEELPLMSPSNEDNIPREVERHGFEQVRVERMPEVDRVEKIGLPLASRLLKVHHRFAVVARAPVA